MRLKKKIYLIDLFSFLFIFFISIGISKKIKIAFYYESLYNGGAQRVTALLLEYLAESNNFKLYLFLNEKVENEYQIPYNIKRIYITKGTNNLIKELKKNKIDIIMYQFYNPTEIRILNNLNNIKTIFIIHCSFLTWIYNGRFDFIQTLYTAYKNSKYVISLVPFENDILFHYWGINSILLSNLITYNYDNIIPSDLSSKTILMIGRGSDPRKRFELGIKAMKYISKELPESEMIIISYLNDIRNLIELVKNIKLEKNIKFVGYDKNPEKYFKNASLNIIPSSTESFSMVLCETKIYGIPNIITGINYVIPAKGGVINILDDEPKTIAKEAINILKNETFRKQLGKEARQSMKLLRNNITIKSWIKLIMEVYKGPAYYNQLKDQQKKISMNEGIKILQQQIELLKKRVPNLKNITVDKIINIVK